MGVLTKRTFGWLGLALAGLIAGLTPRAHAQELLWIRQFGTSQATQARALAPDGAGGVMVAGDTRGSLGGPNAGLADAFLARFAVARRGDLNCDGAFDGADIDVFFLALVDAEAYEAQYPDCNRMLGDMNADGFFDGADIDRFFECLVAGQCP